MCIRDRKNEELMRRAFVNSLYLGLFLSAGMMVMGLTFSGTILRLSLIHI